jgi:hypothetical protein
LKQAVEKASTRFKGPLESPREPWHYDYEPQPDDMNPPTTAHSGHPG